MVVPAARQQSTAPAAFHSKIAEFPLQVLLQQALPAPVLDISEWAPPEEVAEPIPGLCEQFLPAAQAETLEVLMSQSHAAQPMESLPAVALQTGWLQAAGPFLNVEMEEAPFPVVAEPVERLLSLAASTETLVGELPVALPAFALAPAFDALPVEAPEEIPEPVEVFQQPQQAEAAETIFRLSALLEPFAAAPVAVVPGALNWNAERPALPELSTPITIPAADPAERIVALSAIPEPIFGELPLRTQEPLLAPEFEALQKPAAEPIPAPADAWMPVVADAAECEVRLSWRSAALEFPAPAAIHGLAFSIPAAEPALPGLAARKAGPQPQAVDALPHVRQHWPTPQFRDIPLTLPQFQFAAELTESLQPVKEEAPAPTVVPIRPEQAATAETETPLTVVPKPGLMPLEFFFQKSTAKALAHVTWLSTPIEMSTRPVMLKPDFSELEEEQAPPAPAKHESKVLVIQEFFTKRREHWMQKNRAAVDVAVKVAAGIFLGAVLWFSYGTIQISRMNRHAADAANVALRTNPDQTKGGGPIASVRRAIVERAAVEVGDSFHNDLHAWASAASNGTPDWRKHPDGYIRPTGLALFKPTLDYKDYRMEFYGQVEDKAMDWVVRAKDKQNYYAMKFKVVQSGLRPLMALVHYPVVDGKKGKPVETPVNTMIHNNTPYRIALQVKGGHFTASVEGEEVDSWTDTSLPTGGVGFFADAGDKARLYWMKVTKNDDWLGRICAYLAGSADTGADTAGLWGPSAPFELPVSGSGTAVAVLPGFFITLPKGRKRGNSIWNR